jgi:hypothetical protein
MVAVHIEGSRHLPICLFETLFSFQCPFKSCDKSTLRLLKVKSEVTSAMTGEKLVLLRATVPGKLPEPVENWSAACQWDSKPANFSSPPCSPNK